MIRTPLAVALLLAAGVPTPSFAADTPPTTPTGLSAKLYPGAGGELFWKRSTDDRGVRGYEIAVNGRSVGTRDATSLYDASLKPGTPYTFTVTAIDTAGQRSAPATVRLGGAGASATIRPAPAVVPGAARPAAAPAVPAPSSVAGAPAAPAGLRATVYDARSAELFWARSAVPGLRYEVRRDGAVATTSNGTSHYASGLTAGRDHAFQVIAIDGAGRRSAPASIGVRTGAGGGSVTPGSAPASAAPGATSPIATPTTTTTTTPGTAPAAPSATPPAGSTPSTDTRPEIRPANVSIKVYSGTAAELFWSAAYTLRPVILKNEIRRDGVLIATVEGEALRSYFDDEREPGRRYTYEITAISSSGSASARVSDAGASAPAPVTRPATTTPVAGLPANVRAKLDTTFEMVNGVAFEKVVATIGKLSDRTASASLGLRSTGRRAENRNQVVSDVFSCPKGGELLRAAGDTGRFAREIQANDCAIGPIVFGGYVQLDPQVGADDAFRPEALNAIGIELDDARDLSTVTVGQGFFFSGTEPRFSSWSADLSVERPQRGYAATARGNGRDPNNRLPDGSLGLTAIGDAITGPFRGEATLRTLGPMEFANGRDDARPSGGRVSIGTASDGLLIDAGNGDPATFTLTVTNGGATTSYTVPFSDTYRFETVIPTGVDVGF